MSVQVSGLSVSKQPCTSKLVLLDNCMLHKAQSVQGAGTTWKLMLQHVMLDSLHVSFFCHLQHHLSALVKTPDCIFAASRRNAKNMHKRPYFSKDGTTALFLGTSAAALELNKLCLCRQGIMGLG